MDELNPLAAVGMGLSAAGGALNTDVYNQNTNLISQQMAQDARKKQFLGQLLTTHLQQGTISPEAYQQAMGKLGFQIPTMGQTPDYAGSASAITDKLDKGAYLPGGSEPGLGGPGLATPPTPPTGAPADAISGAQIKTTPQDIAPDGTPIPAGDINAPTVPVTAPKVSVYGTTEINQAVSDYAKSLQGQPGSLAMKQKSIKDFRDALKAERKSQLDEYNKISEAENRQSEITARGLDKNTTDFSKNLDKFLKMTPDDPGYKFMQDKITKETTREDDTPFTKELKSFLKMTPESPGYKEAKAHLDKLDAPSSQTIRINDANNMSPDEVNFLAKQVIAGDKSVMSGYSRSPEIKRRIQSEVVAEAKRQGFTPEHLAVLNAEYKGFEAAQRTAGNREAQLGFAVSELNNFVPLASQASSKVPRTSFLPINKLIQMGETQTLSPEQSAFVAANRAVINAFAQVATRGASTVHSMEEAEKMLSTASSHEAYNATLKQLALEAKAAQNAPKDVRKSLSDAVEGKSSTTAEPALTPAPGQGSPKVATPKPVGPVNWNDLK